MQFELTAFMMCADYGNLEREVKELEEGGIDSFHIDIMDGRYVPNYAMSLNDMRYIDSAAVSPLDVHLMKQYNRVVHQAPAAWGYHISSRPTDAVMWAEGKIPVYRYGEISGVAAVSENLSCCTRAMCQRGRANTSRHRKLLVCRTTAREKSKQGAGSRTAATNV